MLMVYKQLLIIRSQQSRLELQLCLASTKEIQEQ